MKLITQRKRETHVFLACPSSSGTVHQTESYSFSIPKANTFNTHEIFHIKRFSALSAIAVRPGTPNDTDVVNGLHTILETGLKVFALGNLSVINLFQLLLCQIYMVK